MKNNDEMMNADDIIKQELLEVLNEISSKFSEVFQKHGMSENEIVTLEFKFFDKTQLEFDDASPKDVRTLSAPLSPNLQFGSTWCPAPRCPPPGRWVG